MPEEWINPKYADLMAKFRAESTAREEEGSMANCQNCGGTGRHIYVDSDGKTKSINCMGCGGSGQTPDQ